MKPNLKICHIITRLDGGGSAQNTLITAIHQAGQGHTVSIIAALPKASEMGKNEKNLTAEMIGKFQEKGGEVLRCKHLVRQISPCRDPLALIQLALTVRRLNPNIIHTHTSKAGILGRLAAMIYPSAVVIHTYHGHVYSGYSGRFKSNLFAFLEKVAAPMAWRLIALTRGEMEDHLRYGVGNRDKFAVIPSGVDLEPFKNKTNKTFAREILGLPREAIIIGAMGRLTEIKGHKYLIEAAARLSDPRLHIALVGEGELQETIGEQAESLRISPRLHLLGWRKDIATCLSAMDIFAMPSLNEGMGKAAVEAMAAGLPIAASRVSGLENVVEDGKTGFLVSPADSAELAGAIKKLVDDEALRKCMGEAGRLAAQRFGVPVMLKALDELLYEAMAKAIQPKQERTRE